MSLNERLFIIVPLISLLCNAFLFAAVLSARKNKLIYAFIALLGSFTMWCSGSLFMRMMLRPSTQFWYQISIIGIFLVPLFIYNFIYCFVEARGQFIRTALFVLWIPTALLNILNIFITDPHIIIENGERRFQYGVSPWIILPILLAAATLIGAWMLAAKAIRDDRVSVSSFRPLMIGVGVMFAGTVAAALPQMVSLPIDTFVCGVNAICLYYSLYNKRLVQLRNLASNSTSYLVAALFSALFLQAAYPSFHSFYQTYFSDYAQYQILIFALGFSLIMMLSYQIIRFLMSKLFVKAQESKEDRLRQFSSAITKTLSLEEILRLYQDFLEETIEDKVARIFLLDRESGNYRAVACTNSSLSIADEIAADHPLIRCLTHHGTGISDSDFQKTRLYRSMWETEKRRFQEMNTCFFLPILCDDELTGITILSYSDSSSKKHPLKFDQITFLESGSAVLSMALKNATLYQDIQNKAHRDSLTNLYNRSYFTECIRRDFDLCVHAEITLLLISFDDFSLYNELYGIEEGDCILKKFSMQLEATAGRHGTVARYGGKEFAVSLPFCTASVAQNCAETMREWLNHIGMDTASGPKKFLTFSAGISSYPHSASNLEQLLSYANMALFSAKSSGKNKIVVYTPSSPEKMSAQNSQARRKLVDNCAATINALTAAIDAKDHYTFNHSQNVASYAAALAAAIPLDADHIEIVRQAGLLHDIGKIGIPEAILSKNGRLTPEEYAIMKQHVEGSIAMIKYLPSLDYVIPSVIGHHERWDGKGYPRGLVGDQNPIAARCLCIADSFDAMTSKRSYRDAMSVPEAIDEIRNNLGTQFDPELGNLFIKLVENGTISIPY
ncbi:MAG: HD domain-containing phosphohydrolase [Candidatus Merdivicinus sp.]